MYNARRVQDGESLTFGLYTMHFQGGLEMSKEDILGSVIRALVNVPTEFLGIVKDFIHKITGVDSGIWIAQGKLFLQQKPCWIPKVTQSILNLISGGKKIVVRATSGKRTIAQAKDVFTWGIDSDFTNWDLDVPGEAKPETPVEIHEMTEDAVFKTIFESLGRNLDELCLTQDQIIVFVEDNKKWLRKDGYATFFLFTPRDEPINADKSNLFVANVRLASDERLYALVHRFSIDRVWNGGHRHRVVVPQQTLVA